MKYSALAPVLSSVSLLSLLMMAGCSHPNAMPTGYTYHHETYKSANPPPSTMVTNAQRETQTPQQSHGIRDAVYDLLMRVTGRAGLPPRPVYVETPDPLPPFMIQIDNDLRESMRAMGYAIADTRQGAYGFTIEAAPITKPRGTENDGYSNIYLTLRVYSDAVNKAPILTEERGHYFIEGAHSYFTPVESGSKTNVQNFNQVKTDPDYNFPSYVPPKTDATYEAESVMETIEDDVLIITDLATDRPRLSTPIESEPLDMPPVINQESLMIRDKVSKVVVEN